MKVKHSIPKELRYSVRDFNNEFPNDDASLEYVKEQRWPDGLTLFDIFNGTLMSSTSDIMHAKSRMENALYWL